MADFRVYNGDCLEVLKDIPDQVIDSVVTDPPAGIAFMGKEWDEDKGGRDQWVAWLASVMRECLRVLKPGGHALVWALPRTSHWTATAVEDAGFEIRDVITHHFGTGFPKSLDVSKAIDKAAGAERERVAVGSDGAHRKPRAMAPGGAVRAAVQTSSHAVTDEAKRWQGWGTALKPASEHWILARKPLIGTVAANVLEHGTGGINIDGCRIGTEGGGTKCNNRDAFGKCLGHKNAGRSTSGETFHGNETFGDGGRFPANLILSHADACVPGEGGCDESCPIREMDGQSTGASRFFYVAKPAASEKGVDGEKNPHPTVKPVALMDYLIRLVTPPGGVVLDPFCGSGTTGVAAVKGGRNFVGMEREAEFAAFAEKRIAAVLQSA